MSLIAEPSTGATRFRWSQIQGPRAILDAPEAASARFVVPQGRGTLVFRLVAWDGEATDSETITISLSEGRHDGRPDIRADAGDDQMGLVGRQLTLTGVRSLPAEGLAYRWIQVGGPEIRLKIEDGRAYTFVPPVPGIYRFALVVAAEGFISEPDFVNVTVGATSPVGVSAPTAASPGSSPVVVPVAESTPELARSALASIQGGGEAASSLAEAFEATSGRVDLYRSYGEAFSELSRRLEEIVPKDPGVRGVWNERLFAPLTSRLVEVMLSEGLDLRKPEGQGSPLTSAQRANLADQLRSMAEGFRACGPPAKRP